MPDAAAFATLSEYLQKQGRGLDFNEPSWQVAELRQLFHEVLAAGFFNLCHSKGATPATCLTKDASFARYVLSPCNFTGCLNFLPPAPIKTLHVQNGNRTTR